MKILVFIKQVADTEARISIQSDGGSIEIENKFAINFFDEFAIEEAVQIKEKNGDAEVTVASYGPKKATEALRTAVAMGADRAFRIESEGFANNDPLKTAKILAAFARQENFDIILCGKQAIDDENSCVGAMIAEILGVPCISSIGKLVLSGGNSVLVESEMNGGRETCEVQMPAVFTTQKDLNTPRVPLITGVMKAMKTSIPEITPTSLGLDPGDINEESSRVITVGYETKKERPPVKIIEGESPEEKVKRLVTALKEEVRIL